jgi:hypothetical protein
VDYVVNTCRHLENLGICPQDLARLRDRLCVDRARTPDRPGPA